jgi:peptide/nickel transport system permease protein
MRLVLKRLLYLVPVLLIVTAGSFSLLQLLPGDPAVNIIGPGATNESVAAKRHELGIDRPLPVQYVNYLKDVAHGDLGYSYQNNQTTTEALKQRLPVTLELLVFSQLLALAFAIPAAMWAAMRPGGWFDRLTTTMAFGFLAVPNFIVGVLLVYVFAVKLQWLPATGYTPFTREPVENLRALFLPSVTLALAEMATYLRLLRTDLITTLQEDFITMAKAKGLSPWRVLLRHAFRPSSFSLVTVAGLNVGRLIGGTVIVEFIFALPGVGALAVQSIFSKDYLVVQGTVLVIAVGYVMVNFFVDLLYAALDPRVRHAAA